MLMRNQWVWFSMYSLLFCISALFSQAGQAKQPRPEKNNITSRVIVGEYVFILGSPIENAIKLLPREKIFKVTCSYGTNCAEYRLENVIIGKWLADVIVYSNNQTLSGVRVIYPHYVHPLNQGAETKVEAFESDAHDFFKYIYANNSGVLSKAEEKRERSNRSSIEACNRVIRKIYNGERLEFFDSLALLDNVMSNLEYNSDGFSWRLFYSVTNPEVCPNLPQSLMAEAYRCCVKPSWGTVFIVNVMN